MKITEQQLRDIIRTTISEALDMGTVNGANRYLNHQGGYTTNQQWNGLGGQLRQRFGAKKDSNGQYDWENSANEIQGYLSQYQNEVRRLTRVYNLITGHVADSNRSAAAKKGATTRAMNRAAGIGPKRTAPKWGNAAYGGMDPSKYNDFRNAQGERVNDVANSANQKWFSVNESTDEGFLQNLFSRNRQQQPDEVEQICRNWRQYVGDNDAAQKVMGKIEEYKGIIGRLKGIIQQGVKGGHIQNMNKVPASAGQQKMVAESLTRFIKKCVNEEIRKRMK